MRSGLQPPKKQTPEWVQSLPFGVRQAGSRLYARWTELRPSTRVVMGIIGVNAGVFMLWRLPLLRVRAPRPWTVPDIPAPVAAACPHGCTASAQQPERAPLLQLSWRQAHRYR